MTTNRTWKTYVPLTVGLLTIASVLTGAAVKVDQRYETRVAAQARADDDERGALETKLELYKLELARLREKKAQSDDDKDQIDYLVTAIKKIKARLEGIQ